MWSKSDSVHQKQPPANTAVALPAALAGGAGAWVVRCAQVTAATPATSRTRARISSLRTTRTSGARRNEAQRRPVHAPPLAGRRRTVVEHVAEMTAASAAMDL